jgi:hypothetical protein
MASILGFLHEKRDFLRHGGRLKSQKKEAPPKNQEKEGA